ncbi:MAG TPA: homoserine dehydrogenase [Stellaceae bacterium]|nr:homoserine dehydrogenase [Stellaceae bacterium]
MTTPLRIGIAGLGTVGAGTFRLLRDNADLIERAAGRPLRVTAISARDRGRDRGIDLAGCLWVDNPLDLVTHPAVDVVVELVGGEDGVARALVEAALGQGKPVVTANKALLAHHGTAIGRLSRARRVPLGFEAAVAGGIPIIKALREGLAANRVTRVYGILNGTCNYVLSAMQQTQRDFGDILAEAQQLGYAEADPGLDIDGIDAAHKLAILAGVAFGTPVDLKAVYVEGIRHISALDIAYADELGYRIKLLGLARRTPQGIEQRVHPCMVPSSNPLAAVDGVFNAVVVEGDVVGRVVLQGRGAGAGPTASAVVADLIDIASGRGHAAQLADAPTGDASRSVGMEHHLGGCYIRLMVQDQPGVIADVAAALRNERISMEAMLQRGRAPGGTVPVVLTTHPGEEQAMRRALGEIALLAAMTEPPRMIRIET